jgi:hypothetical protein
MNCNAYFRWMSLFKGLDVLRKYFHILRRKLLTRCLKCRHAIKCDPTQWRIWWGEWCGRIHYDFYPPLSGGQKTLGTPLILRHETFRQLFASRKCVRSCVVWLLQFIFVCSMERLWWVKNVKGKDRGPLWDCHRYFLPSVLSSFETRQMDERLGVHIRTSYCNMFRLTTYVAIFRVVSTKVIFS